jgi:hypothetical protein
LDAKPESPNKNYDLVIFNQIGHIKIKKLIKKLKYIRKLERRFYMANTYNADLSNNNALLQAILTLINNLPENEDVEIIL